MHLTDVLRLLKMPNLDTSISAANTKIAAVGASTKVSKNRMHSLKRNTSRHRLMAAAQKLPRVRPLGVRMNLLKNKCKHCLLPKSDIFLKRGQSTGILKQLSEEIAWHVAKMLLEILKPQISALRPSDLRAFS